MKHSKSLLLLAFTFISLLYAFRLPVQAAAQPGPRGGFVLEELVGHEWHSEAVRFDLTPQQQQKVKEQKVLLGPNDKPVAYQVVSQANGLPAAIEFMADLPKWEKREYYFGDAAQTTATDIKIEEDEDTIRLYNSRVGIALRKGGGANQGPIAGIRLNSGKWIGDSTWDIAHSPITDYHTEILARGPVFREIRFQAKHANFNGTSSMTLRLNAGEPVVTVDETMALGDTSAFFYLSLSDNFSPDKIFYRFGQQTLDGDIGKNAVSDLKNGDNFVLEPWLRWWIQPTEGPVFSVFNSTGPDLLTVGTCEAGVWVDPAEIQRRRNPPEAWLTRDDKGVNLKFCTINGRRKWFIAALPREESLEVMKDPKDIFTPPLPYRYQVKYGHFPLNLVKDYVLSWDQSKDKYPRLMITPQRLARFRESVKDKTPYENAIPGYIKDPNPLYPWTVDDRLKAYFATGNEAMEKYLVDYAINDMQSAVDAFLVQPRGPYGAAPHHLQMLNMAPTIADAILDCKQVSPELRRRLLGQIAFLGYAEERPEFWAPEKGFGGTPNMTTSVLDYQLTSACVIPSHPRAQTWAAGSLKQLKEQLDTWSDDNGGWLEAPHYAMVSIDALLAAFWKSYNAGFDQNIYDPKFKKIMYWFAKISTPPDSRFGGFRHLPPVGNTYVNEPCGEFGLVAGIWKDKDPQFAAEMQWMFAQQKSWPQPGVGGGYPAFAGYRTLLLDPAIPEKIPQWESELFPNTNVLLRSHFPSARETHLDLLAGSFGGWRSHWDDDSGSFTLWGKGRIIVDDFGYYARAPIEDCSMPDAAEIGTNPIFKLKTFVPAKDSDYVNGARGPWTRQILFLKNDDPLAANYYVLCDSFNTAAPPIWRLWLTAKNVTVGTGTALVEGQDDVDTDVFFTAPEGLNLKTESKNRTSGGGVRADGTQGPVPVTQTGLIATPASDGAMTYVLFPRVKTQKPPVFTALAGGKGVRVQHENGTDYIFLSPRPFTFSEGTISFSGTSGSIRFRPGQMVLSLAEGGSIAARGQSLSSDQAGSKSVAMK